VMTAISVLFGAVLLRQRVKGKVAHYLPSDLSPSICMFSATISVA
jgi:hypothetical protein